MKKVGQTKTHKHTTGSLAKAQANAQSFTICAFAKPTGVTSNAMTTVQTINDSAKNGRQNANASQN